MGRPGIVTNGAVALAEHELLARIFRTLGEPTRLRIIEALLELGTASQSDIIHEVGISQSRASEHLGVLAWCGLVTAERAGRAMVYRLVGGYAEGFVRMGRSFLYDCDDAVGGCTVLVDLEESGRR